jgi:RNA polymerase sigma-70 factor (ECF subfamily)
MPDTPIPETGSPSDEELMAALQAGDDSALATLMERWELGLKAFLMRLGVPPSDVDDVAQESFVRLYEKRGRYRTGAAFKPWLLTLAGNLGRNRLRWRQRRREESIQEFDEMRPGGREVADAGAPPASVLAEKAGVALAVRSAVQSLPPPLREAVVCVELEELGHREAAQVLGCSEKAVETRLYRARRMLRTALQALTLGG